MCGGGDDKRRKAEREAERLQREANEQAEKRQRELDEQAAARQLELDALAAARADTARQQQERRNQLEVQAQSQIAAQTAQGIELSRQQDLRIKGMRDASTQEAEGIRQRGEAQAAAIREEGERKSRRIKTVGGAVASSLRAMAIQQPVAPAAGQTSQKDRKKGAANKQAELRRGSTVTRGPNLSI